MALGARTLLLGVALCAPLCALACDPGGLLVVTENDGGVPGHTATDFVSGGNVAKSQKYTIVYTFGQATPDQGVSTEPNNSDHGGLVGAMNGN
jgi:hypothetical protein